MPEILATSKQIYAEAKDLLWENTFQVTFIACALGACRPAIHRRQLPAHAMPQIQRLTLVIDCVRFENVHCDAESLQAVMALKTLRLIAVEEADPTFVVTAAQLAAILAEIIARVPASCDVYFGSRSHEERCFVAYAMDKLREKTHNHRRADAIGELREMDYAKTREAAMSVPKDVVQGSKSGVPSSRRALLGDGKGFPMMGG